MSTLNANTGAFFNIKRQKHAAKERVHFGAPRIHWMPTSWSTFAEQPLNGNNLIELFANHIPVIRHEAFLNPDELHRMLAIVEGHELGEYDTEFTWPRVGTSGITQYDHLSRPHEYFDKVAEAEKLQLRWKSEAGIDIIERIIKLLQEASNMPVRRAREGDKEYFAGILRAVERGINVHADYAPYEAADWSIENIVGQLTWNILLNKVSGGDTLIYDRQWRAPDDDEAWRKVFPRDSYQPQMLEGHGFKAMRAVPGDLTFFNPRNFHEVKACDISRDHPVADIRFTISSFVGYLPSEGHSPATLVLWS